MKLTFISDTHNKHYGLSEIEGDIIFHSGDLVADHNSMYSYTTFFKWFSSLRFAHKVFIAGNHDMFFDNKLLNGKDIFEEYGIHYLENSGIEIEGLKIWGSPNTPKFFNWFFMKEREDLVEVWKEIPEDLDVLLTHGPPCGIGDFVKSRRSKGLELVGDKALLDAVILKQPKIHSFGHVHEGYGIYSAPQLNTKTLFLNSSRLDYRYNPVNAEHNINYEKGNIPVF
jgi:Icc-related predicted phosphoesterase